MNVKKSLTQKLEKGSIKINTLGVNKKISDLK